jgi:hypothetical protein
MSYEELQTWMEYFDKRPYQWREDQRVMLNLKSKGVKVDMETMFPTLHKINQSNSMGKSIKESSFFKLMQNAKGGDKLDVFEDG